MSESDSIAAVRAALQNELVLSEIFKFLGIKNLLSCSLVNKKWNDETRTYIRDHRKCTLLVPSKSSACNFLPMAEINKALGRMKIVPFNSLEIALEAHHHGPETRLRRSRNPNHHPEELKNSIYWKSFFSKMKLRFLSISWHHEVMNCPTTSIVSRLLLEKGSELESLEFVRIPNSPEIFTLEQKEKKLEFPKLEELKIQRVFDWIWRKDLLAELLDGSSKLKRISYTVGYEWILEILPKTKYNLLENLTIREYKTEMKSLVPFENLLCFHLDCSRSFTVFENSFPQIKFGQLFPKLNTVELSWLGPRMMVVEIHRTKFVEEENDELVYVESNSPYTSKTALKLILKTDEFKMYYPALKQRFPELTELHLFPGHFRTHRIPYAKIFRFWPNLKKLFLSGTVYKEHVNADQVFCGVTQEELELLWTYDEKYLKCLQIVPVRPCLSTMPNLEAVEINLVHYGIRSCSTRRNPSSLFLSSVTKCLVFDRMPWLDVRLNFSPE